MNRTLLLALLAAAGSTQAQTPPSPTLSLPDEPPSPPFEQARPAETGRTAETVAGRVGQRQTRDQGIADPRPMSRIDSRIQNRVESRLRTRIDRNYDPQFSDPFAAAEDRVTTRPPR